MKKIIRFLVSGGSAAALEFTVFFFMSMILGPSFLFASQTVSFLYGFILSFFLQKAWVFKSKGNIKSELLKYGLLATINLVISNLLLWILVDQTGLNDLLSKVAVMVLIAVWNFFIFQKVVFRK